MASEDEFDIENELAALSSAFSVKFNDYYLLICDDEEAYTKYFSRYYERVIPCLRAADGKQAIDFIDEYGSKIALVFTDERMPGAAGHEVIAYAKDKIPLTIRMMMSAALLDLRIEETTKEMLDFEFLLKPCQPEDVKLTVIKGIEYYMMRQDKLFEKSLVRKYNFNISQHIKGLVAAIEEEGWFEPTGETQEQIEARARREAQGRADAKYMKERYI